MNPLITGNQASGNAGINNAMQFVKLLRSAKNNPQEVAAQMMQSNPQFKQFMDSVKGKTPEQFAKEHGIDISGVLNKI